MTATDLETALPLDARLLSACRRDVVFALLPPFEEVERDIYDWIYTISPALLWKRKQAHMAQCAKDRQLDTTFTITIGAKTWRLADIGFDTTKLGFALEADRYYGLWQDAFQEIGQPVPEYVRRFLDHARKSGMGDNVLRVGLDEDVDLGLAQWLTERRAALMGNLYLLVRKAEKVLGRKLTDQEITAVMLAAFESTDAPAEYVRRIGVLVGFAVENAKNVEHAKFMITDLLPTIE